MTEPTKPTVYEMTGEALRQAGLALNVHPETDEQLRLRILARLASQPVGGTASHLAWMCDGALYDHGPLAVDMVTKRDAVIREWHRQELSGLRGLRRAWYRLIICWRIWKATR